MRFLAGSNTSARLLRNLQLCALGVLLLAGQHMAFLSFHNPVPSEAVKIAGVLDVIEPVFVTGVTKSADAQKSQQFFIPFHENPSCFTVGRRCRQGGETANHQDIVVHRLSIRAPPIQVV